MSLSTISEDIIHRNATPQSLSRGEAYYNAGAVAPLTQRGNLIQASVEGSDLEPYRVSVQFDGKGITSATCTCPYDYEGWCKHIVATLLMCAHQPGTIETRPTLSQLLDRLDHVQTQRLVQELVDEQPELIDAIDRHVTLITAPVPQKQPAKAARRTALDPAPFRRQVKQIIREGLRYLEDGWEGDDPIAEGLIEIIDKAQAFSQKEDGNSAIVILEVVTATCADEADELSDYGADLYAVAEILDEAWTEAILSADLSDEQKVDLGVMLEEWQSLMDGSFSMSLEALRQGWDYPPLQRVLQGNITEQGVWEGDPPDYADDLALIRLRILDRQERDQEYLHLAVAEGQTTQYLTKLAELGQTDAAIEAARTNITTPDEAFTFAKILQEQQRFTDALEIAQLGLALPDQPNYALADWTSDLAEGLNNSQIALDTRVLAFKIRPSFRDYCLAENLAGKQWSTVKADLLKTLQRHQQWGAEAAKVDIFLHEGLIDDAIKTAQTLSSFQYDLLRRVMRAAIVLRPEWVIETGRKLAEPIMVQKKADRYSEAIEWLKQVKAAYLQLGQSAEWSAYRAQLVEQHARLRKLMELFKQRGIE